MIVYGKCECFVLHMLYVESYVHPVAVLNAAFCMTCSLIMLVEDTRGDNMDEAYSRADLMTATYMCVSLCLLHHVAVSVG